MIEQTFKELLRGDAKNVFMNPDEFGEEHTVNGRTMNIIIDDNELTERQKRIQSTVVEGLYQKQTLIYVCAVDFGPLPGVGKPLIIDGKTFIITDSMNEAGIYSIHLEVNRS